MGIKKAFAPLVLSVGLGIGTAGAVHEVGELNQEADRIQACLDAKETTMQFCYEYPMTTLEVTNLRQTAAMTGFLGWIGFFGAVGTAISAIERSKEEDSMIFEITAGEGNLD